MVEIDPLTGLPKELLAMEDIVREQQSIKVHVEKRRYGKLVTVIDGMGKGVDIVDLAKQLKRMFGHQNRFPRENFIAREYHGDSRTESRRERKDGGRQCEQVL